MTLLTPMSLSALLLNQSAKPVMINTVTAMSVLPNVLMKLIPSLSKMEVSLAENAHPDSIWSSTQTKTDVLVLQVSNSSTETVSQLLPTVWTFLPTSLQQALPNQAVKSLLLLRMSTESQPALPFLKLEDLVPVLHPPSQLSLAKHPLSTPQVEEEPSSSHHPYPATITPTSPQPQFNHQLSHLKLLLLLLILPSALKAAPISSTPIGPVTSAHAESATESNAPVANALR